MTKSLFFVFSLAAMIATVTALGLRYELAAPGVSALFSMQDGAPDGAMFSRTAMLHAMMSYLAAMALGTLMIASARHHGARLSGLFVWIGVVLCALTVLILITAYIPMTWVGDDAALIDDPLIGSTLTGLTAIQEPTTLWTYLTIQLPDRFNLYETGVFGLTNLTRFLVVPAAGLLYIGAFSMMSADSGSRWLPLIGVFLVFMVAAPSVPLIHTSGTAFWVSGWLLPSFVLLAVGAIRLIDGGPAWLLVLTLGVLVSVVAQLGLMIHPLTPLAQGTMADIMPLYIYPLGLAWFALPAILMFNTASRLGDLPAWGIAAALTAGLALWILPLLSVGHKGQPLRYIDYPDAFAVGNMIASIAAFAFTFLLLAVVVFVRRARP